MTGWAIARMIPRRFDGAQATDLHAGLELRVRERPGHEPLRLTLEIADGACRVRRGPGGDAKAVAVIGLADLIRLALGRVGWPQLMSAGRLELSGDPFLALRFATLFRLPARARGARGRSPA